jgi:hypothetical protein
MPPLVDAILLARPVDTLSNAIFAIDSTEWFGKYFPEQFKSVFT